MNLPEWMPPLPEESPLGFRGRGGWVTGSDGYTSDQMLAFAIVAVEAYKASLKPVATFGPYDGRMQFRLKDGEIFRAGDKFYRLD